MKIDFHAHYYPSSYLDLLDRFGGTPAGTGGARALRGGNDPGEIDERIAAMDSAGVSTQVLSAPSHVGYFDRRPDAVAAAQAANDLFAELVRMHPGRFVALGTIPLPHVDAALDEIARCLDDLSMPGIALMSSIAGRGIASTEFEPVYAELDRRGAIVLLHPEMTGAYCALVNDFDLTRMIGWAIEDSVALMQLYQRGILERYPNMRIVSVHLGGFLPFLLGALDDRARRIVPDLALPSEMLRRVYYDTATNSHADALRLLVAAMGSQKVLMGTDYPFSRGERFAHGVEAIARAGLGEEATTAIYHDNAVALLGDSFPSSGPPDETQR